jgi:hypothetical protein
MSLAQKVICWRVIRNDGVLLQGTGSSRDIKVTDPRVAGLYKSETGIHGTTIRSNTDLSVDNMEVSGALFSTAIQALDIEAGLYDGAAVTVFETAVDAPSSANILRQGTLGQQTRKAEGEYTFEVRGPAQRLAQPFLEVISKSCRVKQLGDSRCKRSLADLTFTGLVDTVQGDDTFTDLTLGQTGVPVEYVDTTGSIIPATGLNAITPVVPSGGIYISDQGVTYSDGTPLAAVAGAPGPDQYQVTIVSGVATYYFNPVDGGRRVLTNFDYTYGYFVNGALTWLTGANAGLSNIVRTFVPANGPTPASIQLFIPQPKGIAPGDTYRIVAGCNRLLGTCRDRFNNIVNFRGEPYTPGPDALARVLG